MNLARCTPADEILVAYVTDMSMQKKVMTKKGHQIFGQEKCTPAEKILAMPMEKSNKWMINETDDDDTVN